MKRILIDTNAYSKLFLGSQQIVDILSMTDEVYLSVIVLGELYTGFRGGSKYEKNIKALKGFLDDPIIKVLRVSEDAAEIFGEIKHYLRVKGKPIPINDIWIAAQSIETGSLLLSYDEHFKEIPQVRLWSWEKNE